jgi:hypothetical protein
MTVDRYGNLDNDKPTLRDEIDALKDQVSQLERRLFELENSPAAPIQDDDELNYKCRTCGLEWSGTMGYVCSRSDCPMQTKVGDFPFGLNTGG